MPVSPDQLLEAGVTRGLVQRDALTPMRVEARQRREPLLRTVSRHCRFPEAALYRALAETKGLPFIDLNTEPLEPELVARMPEALLTRRLVAPVALHDGEVLVAVADPDDRSSLQTVERIFGVPARVVLSDPESLRHAVERVRRQRGSAPVSELDSVAALDRILSEAYLRRASDVHLEPNPQGLQVRLRIDGRLQLFQSGFDRASGHSLVSRVKVLAGLDIAEQRAPQDGRFSYTPVDADNLQVDIRVATIPTRWGERATLRLLGTEAEDLTLEMLGMTEEDLVRFQQAIRRPYGIILLTGPTGSGKTTTLYAALRAINQSHLNIVTVEDPIEYLMPGVSQVHIGGSDKVTFASALRSLLRHDPDVMMVGEIRDFETADVAMKAAMTGHLLFSTLHTNSACGAITRLIDLGCEPFLVGATLAGVIAQRLVRRLCSVCRRPRPSTDEEARMLGVELGTEIFEPAGCSRCLGSGYFGRIGVFEPLWIDSPIARLISRGASQSEIEAHVATQLKTLRADGYAKVLRGVTSLEEVLSVTVAEV